MDHDLMARLDAINAVLARIQQGQTSLSNMALAHSDALARIMALLVEEPEQSGSDLADALRRLAMAIEGQDARLAQLIAVIERLPDKVLARMAG